MLFNTAALVSLIPLAASHGLITTPPSRPVGPAIIANCGAKVEQDIRLDNTSHVEGLPELAAKDAAYNAAKCNLWLCKGLQFADNPTANIQTWTPGQVIPIKVWLRIPHEGSANVSIVETKSDKIVGTMLKVWAKGYAPGKKESDVPLDQTQFNVTVPEGLEDKCATAGDCVLQWWWYGTGAKQTYESCVDFKIVKKGMRDGSPGRMFRA
ncbi:Nn.00g105860.m01.CDS01 [Neocucurbitaria sp. VM-36]